MRHSTISLAGMVICAGLFASACGGDGARPGRAAPVSPSALAAWDGPSGASLDTGRVPSPSAPFAVPPVTVSARAVPFPPRDESFAFRSALEAKYRDGLRRSPSSSHVDVEGDVVWTQEYLRYRVNGCGHAESVQRVLAQVEDGVVRPVCADTPAGPVAFPPRDESFAFRLALERTYRDGLGRAASPTYVDVEGSLVWVQEYLRYRVNACDHLLSEVKVFDQIDGRGIAPDCLVGERTLTGVWRGTSTYWNAPFEMHLVQRGSVVTGTYQDQKDRGTVSEYPGQDEVSLLVYFGDAGLLLRGRFTGDRHVEGTIGYGGRTWPFQMEK